MATDGITVIDVCRELKVEPEPHLTWSIGARVRDWYEMNYGVAPVKRLRPKTTRGGSHCFAVYPHHMWDLIANIIRMHQTEMQRQGELPF